MEKVEIKININKKTLLIPASDRTETDRVSIKLNEDDDVTELDIPIAKGKIDYWVPINVAKYIDKTIILTINGKSIAKEELSLIKQVDKVDFEYKEDYRPIYHFSPTFGWMNDPNGMVYQNGYYHLFYQYNPFASKWGNMSWGHAISKDLINWKHLPIALFPDKSGGVFSGSAIIDKTNAADTGKDNMLLFYTSADKYQDQNIAYSSDSGQTFTRYKNNPILSDHNIKDFRDPKLFWHKETNRWIMSLATSQTITFYASTDLRKWEKLSEFGEGIGNHGGVWECPDLFPLTYNGTKKWILLVSINPGGPNGGSATQYFIGDFDGSKFTADPLPYPLWIDSGMDNYAGVTWNNAPDDKHIFIGWMSNWLYSNEVPSKNFRNAMTVPRILSLGSNDHHLILLSNPIDELKSLRGEKQEENNIKINTYQAYHMKEIGRTSGGSAEIEIELTLEELSPFAITLKNKKEEELKFLFNPDKEQLEVDRRKSGLVDFDKDFAKGLIKGELCKSKDYHLRLFIDKASCEIFINNGATVQTNTMFPTVPYDELIIQSIGNAEIKQVVAYDLNKINK